MSEASETPKKKRGPRLPLGDLAGLWYELKGINNGLKDGTIQDSGIDRARARVHVLSQMLAVADRLLEERTVVRMQAQIEELRAAVSSSGAIVTTSRPALPEPAPEATTADAAA